MIEKGQYLHLLSNSVEVLLVLADYWAVDIFTDWFFVFVSVSDFIAGMGGVLIHPLPLRMPVLVVCAAGLYGCWGVCLFVVEVGFWTTDSPDGCRGFWSWW